MRRRVVTRTITTSKGTAKVYNPDTDKIFTDEFLLSGELDVDAATKILKKTNVNVLKVTNIESETKLYVMDEDEFITRAEVVEK